jgi:hypothetical protein
MKKTFIYNPKTVRINSLKKHLFYETVGSFMPTDKFMKDFEYFGYLETPVVTLDGLILTHTEDVIAATLMGDEEIDVVVMENASSEDLTRFIDFRSTVKYGKNRRIMYQTIDFLKEFLTKDKDGKELAKTLVGSKTRDKIAKLLNISSSNIHNIITIGNDDPAILDNIDKGITTSSKALDDISKTKKNDKGEDNSTNPDGDANETDDSVKIGTSGSDSENEDTPPTCDNTAEEQVGNVRVLPLKRIATMMIIYDDGTEMTIENIHAACTLKTECETVPLQYTSKLVRSGKKHNNNIAIEHDFMPRYHEKFQIGVVIRSEAA